MIYCNNIRIQVCKPILTVDYSKTSSLWRVTNSPQLAFTGVCESPIGDSQDQTRDGFVNRSSCLTFGVSKELCLGESQTLPKLALLGCVSSQLSYCEHYIQRYGL